MNGYRKMTTEFYCLGGLDGPNGCQEIRSIVIYNSLRLTPTTRLPLCILFFSKDEALQCDMWLDCKIRANNIFIF